MRFGRKQPETFIQSLRSPDDHKKDQNSIFHLDFGDDVLDAIFRLLLDVAQH
jgi:hypothetical protein